MTNGNSVFLRNNLEIQNFDGRHKEFECDMTNDVVYLRVSQNKIITISGGINNGDIRGIYVDKIYQWLPVKNRTVIDIGGNIGD